MGSFVSALTGPLGASLQSALPVPKMTFLAQVFQLVTSVFPAAIEPNKLFEGEIWSE